MPPEGIEIVQRSRLRENRGSMEFAETKEVSRRSPRELTQVCSLHFKVGRSFFFFFFFLLISNSFTLQCGHYLQVTAKFHTIYNYL